MIFLAWLSFFFPVTLYADDVSSISGSDSSDCESNSESESQSCLNGERKGTGYCNPRSQRVLFKNSEAQLISVFRCVLLNTTKACQKTLWLRADLVLFQLLPFLITSCPLANVAFQLFSCKTHWTSSPGFKQSCVCCSIINCCCFFHLVFCFHELQPPFQAF